MNNRNNGLDTNKLLEAINSTHTEQDLNVKALNHLGVIYEITITEGPIDTSTIFKLAGGWEAKWFRASDCYRLKLVTNDKDKRFLLNKGIVRYFMSVGFSKFNSVALLKSRIKYKIELAYNLKAIIDNSSYHLAFKSHPFYVDFDITDTSHPKYENQFKKSRAAWFESWGEIFEGGLLNITLKQECELIKMIKVMEVAEVLFLQQQALLANQPVEVKPVNKHHNNKFNKKPFVKKEMIQNI